MGDIDSSITGRKVLLADDHDVVRRGLSLLLESQFGLEVIEASNAQDAVAFARDPSVDLALLDVRLPGHDGLWALREIRSVRADLPVVMLSTFSDADYVQTAIEFGANGYILKEASTQQLRDALKTALSGDGLYLHPSVAHRVLQRRRSIERARGLSDRELEVLRLVAVGSTNDDIATKLFLSEKTVKSHLSSIFRKLEVTNRTQAAAKALREGIVAQG
jgi:DNA-binding NarL/FixJ family response regulator